MDEEMKDSDRTQPVQARDEEGRPVWQHDRCGFVSSDPVLVGSEGACPADGGNASWLPLYVLSAAPDGDLAPEEQVFPAPPHRYERGPYQVDGSQACGICGSRRAAAVHRQQPQPDNRAPEPVFTDDDPRMAPRRDWSDRQPDLMAQVREALGVERPEDVLAAIATERANFADAAQQIARLMYERDEARAEVERYRRDAALEDGLVESLYAEIDRLKAAQPNPLVLRLPEVPPGTVALHAVGSTNVYSWPGDDLAQILEAEPEGVTVELAPEPEPQPRTAAEVWAGMREALRAELRDHTVPCELVDALDREARQALINEKGL